MSGQAQDLSGLRRAQGGAATDVPPPRRSAVTRFVLPAVLIALFAGLLAFAARDLLTPRLEVHAVPVVVKSGAGGGAVAGQAAGWVEPDPFAVHVQALTEGVVAEVLVLEGAHVAAGDVVARLVPDDARIALRRAEASAEAAEREVAAAAARHEAALATWENPFARDAAVASATARESEASAELAEAVSEAEAEGHRSAEVELRLARAESDLRGGAIGAGEVAELRIAAAAMKAAAAAAESRVRAARARHTAAAAELVAANEGARLRIEERLALAESAADLARARAAAVGAVADRDEAALRCARIEVRAPVAGVVLQRLVEPGFRLPVDSGSGPRDLHVVSLYDPARLQVRADVPLSQAAAVGVGQKARIVVEVLPDRTFDGEVTRVVHTADIQKNTLQVKVAIRDPAPELKPEMLARVQFLVTEGAGPAATSQRVFAPERLLVRTGAGDAVVWVAAGDVAERRTVVTGAGAADGWVEIASGLRPGDELIDADPATLTPGRKITVLGERAEGVR